jgi:hypothetical protein
VSRLNATQKSRCAPAGASVVAEAEHVCPSAIGLATSPLIGTSAALAVPAAPSAIATTNAAIAATIHRPIDFSPELFRFGTPRFPRAMP